VVTHAHPDHVMAVPLLREIFPQATVLASGVAAKTLSFEKAVSFFSKIDAELTKSLLKAGLIKELHCPKPLAEPAIAVDRTVGEGDQIEVDGLVIQVLETPGHSDCSLSFHEPQQRVLVISDATGFYMPEHDALWPCYFTGYGAYLASIERLAALDAEIVCLSHNGAISGADEVRAYFDRAIAATKEYHQRIVDEAGAGKSAREIAERLGTEIHEKTQLLPVEFFQKNCALMVKQSFLHEGIGEEK
jgi:glyoxylase-like metal-dependent hydrolase (beta-lactamase superfamily II)